ncbi:hypothetical protein PN465_03935 [Nodularia spumigena CS-584]|jgi:hypothetical protein|nr:hypothetical protein [Nodularia spumigena]MDB9381390.1 hypothetical protein [Nodularia spumigena CS-584]
MSNSMQKISLLLQYLITGLTFATSINVANASPFARADFVNESQFNSQAIFSYVDLGRVTKLGNSKYKYLRLITPADFVGEYIESEENLAKRKLLESEVIVNCNDINLLQIQQDRYYRSGKLIKTDNTDKVIRHSESNPLKEGNLIVCRLFDTGSSQPLKPGFYFRGSIGIQIAIKGNRICYEGMSRYGRTVASVIRDPKYLSFYKLESVKKKGQSPEPFYLMQLTSDAIHYGDFMGLSSIEIDRGGGNTNSKEMQRCLKSNKTFSFFEESEEFKHRN